MTKLAERAALLSSKPRCAISEEELRIIIATRGSRDGCLDTARGTYVATDLGLYFFTPENDDAPYARNDVVIEIARRDDGIACMVG